MQHSPLAPALGDIVRAEAIANATVQPAGPRTGSNGLAFFNIEGANNGSFASYGAIRFDVSSIKNSLDTTFGGRWVIDSVALELTQSNAGFSRAGLLDIYFGSDNSTSLANDGSSPLRYPDGGSPLSLEAAPVGNINYTVISNGAVDSGTLTSSGINSAVLGGGFVTLVVKETDPGVAATYAGFMHSTLAGPTIVVSASAVPEPSSLALLALGGLVIAVRRK